MSVKEQLTKFNRIYKEMDKLYHDYAKACGLTDLTFWILYALWEQGEGCTQRELCEEWCYISQSANSALKALEKQGVIQMRFREDNRKSKGIYFTEEGRIYAEKLIAPVIRAELAAFEKMNPQDRKAMLDGLEKNSGFLKEEIKEIEIRKQYEK